MDNEIKETTNAMRQNVPLTSMLGFICTTCIWSYQIMPTFMARWAKVGLRPAICLAAKQMPRRPMMIFSTFRTANFTDKGKLKRVKLLYFNIGFFHCLPLSKSRYSLFAIGTIKRIFRIPARVNIEANPPHFLAAMLTWKNRVVNFIFPRGISHETLSFLL